MVNITIDQMIVILVSGQESEDDLGTGKDVKSKVSKSNKYSACRKTNARNIVS